MAKKYQRYFLKQKLIGAALIAGSIIGACLIGGDSLSMPIIGVPLGIWLMNTKEPILSEPALFEDDDEEF